MTMFRVLLLTLLGMSFSVHAAPATVEKAGCVSIGEHQQCMFKFGSNVSYSINGMPYALCAQAKCTLNKDKQTAQCQCPIYGIDNSDWQSISLSAKPYIDVKPSYDGKVLKQVTSNFSLAMAPSPSNLIVPHTTCTFKKAMPWANCFGVRCDVETKMVNGVKTSQATCQCPVQTSTYFISSGPANNSQCILENGQIWSAAEKDSGLSKFEIISHLYQSVETSSGTAKTAND